MPPKPTPKAALYVRLPVAQAEQLDRAVDELGTSKADLVAGLISKYVGATPTPIEPPRPVIVRPGEMTTGFGMTYSSEPLEVLTPKQAAELLQVDENTVVRLAENGELPGRKLGKAWRFSRRALLGWLGGEER